MSSPYSAAPAFSRLSAHHSKQDSRFLYQPTPSRHVSRPNLVFFNRICRAPDPHRARGRGGLSGSQQPAYTRRNLAEATERNRCQSAEKSGNDLPAARKAY